MDIAAWLQDLGLQRYVQTFRDHEIDPDVLADLTEADLEKLGIPLGHRKKLLRAIAGLTVTEAQPPAPSPSSPTPAVARDAERRQLSVMFVDLVGSTELAGRLDPEDMAQVVGAYQQCCAKVIKRWEGHVAKYMGDGVLAYFGWPRAHEDEAERAVRAGLAIVDAVARLDTSGGPLAARVGIATGLVMVGELIGEGAAQEQTVVGETPNLAARLQALATPGSVVVSQATRRLVGGLFTLADLGPARLKGFAEPLAAWRVEGEGRAEGRFEALRGEHMTPLVGREHELGILLDRWAEAKDGDGQVMLLAGEPGIGKSRVVRALRERLGDEPHVALSHFCSPHHTNSALYPVIAQLERAAELKAEDGSEARLAKLEALLGQATSELDEAAPLIAALLGIPAGERYPALNLDPQRQKQRTLEVLLEQLAGLARQRPVLELYEDVHWIDPSSLELLDLLVERVRGLRVLAVLTFRPEFEPPWSAHAHVTTLTMSRLGRGQGAELVARVTDDKPLPAAIVEQIVARTDGVPLFVEELTKTVLESGLLTDTGDRYELSGPLPPLAIPTTLHDSLMARLDRLAPVKEVAQIGAVIGREFSHQLLAAVADRHEAQLRSALDELVSSELMFRCGSPPEATYSFKHALVQDAAYQSLLKSRRQQMHARIAKVLEERFSGKVESEPELLAYHCTEAGLGEKAVGYWYEAGRLALGRSAMVEAVAHFTHGLDLLINLADTSRRAQWELKLRVALGSALAAARGTGAPETGQAYARALELCDQTSDRSLRFPALFGLTRFHFSRAELAPALELAERALNAGRQEDDDDTQLAAHVALGWVSLALGRLHAARAHLQQALALPDSTGHEWRLTGYGVNLRVVSLVYLSWTLFILGSIDRAQDLSRRALVEAKTSVHPLTLCLALDRATAVAYFCREITTAAERADEMFALGEEQNFLAYVAKGDFFRGWKSVEEGRPAEGMASMRTALATLQANRDKDFVPLYVVQLAAAHARAGQASEALTLVQSELTRVASTGERLFEAELHRLEGELLLSLPTRDDATAVECFGRALSTAREQEAKSWELRAATSLARLWAEQGKRAESYDLLAPIYGWFTEGFHTADLKEAKTLLDELR